MVSDAEKEAIVKLAAKTAIEEYKREQREQQKRVKKSLADNTKKLLRNYMELKAHVENAVIQSRDNMPSQLQLVLSEIFDHRGFIKIQAIVASKERTELMIKHVDTMLDTYMKQCERDKTPYYEVITRYYINREGINDIASALSTEERTVYRYAKKGISDMSVLLWGILGISSCQ